eukprot:GDKH01008381.1.p1 GENE.GDKH01008381.1~~GDKH01008381.1.p1  ORF type:complete len:135 (-),score=41.65 GDKH01008381.1:247-651(-)
MSAATKKRIITKAELAKHKSEKDCWIAIHGIVYDITKFLPDHPGGPEIVVTTSGRDASEEFEEIGHSDNSRTMAEEYEIGMLEGWEPEAATGCVVPESKKKENESGGGGFGLLPMLAVALIAVGAYFIYNTQRA